jgi:hypothetical protein
VDVYQVSRIAAIGESPDLRTDDVVEGEHRAVRRVDWRPGKPFLEDVDLAVFAKLRICHHEPCGHGFDPDDTHLPATLRQAFY